MRQDTNDDLQHAQELLSHLAPAQVAAVVHLIEVMLDPGSRALADAPLEDEEIGEDEESALAEAREWLKHNKPIPHEEVLADFGLTIANSNRWAGRRCRRSRAVQAMAILPKRSSREDRCLLRSHAVRTGALASIFGNSPSQLQYQFPRLDKGTAFFTEGVSRY